MQNSYYLPCYPKSELNKKSLIGGWPRKNVELVKFTCDYHSKWSGPQVNGAIMRKGTRECNRYCVNWMNQQMTESSPPWEKFFRDVQERFVWWTK